jgi:hypothetical protein
MGLLLDGIGGVEEGRRRLLGGLGIALVALALLFTAQAKAGQFGELGSFGSSGTGPGQLFNSSLMGVDPVDGSVYVVDFTGDFSAWRVQKFSETGTFLGSVDIPLVKEGGESQPVRFVGIAVDHTAGKFYLLQYGTEADSTAVPARAAAQKILAFSTTPDGSKKLVPATPATIPVPSPTGTEPLDKPTDISVDPGTGNLVILAEDRTEHFVVERLSPTGTVVSRFADSTQKLKPTGTPDQWHAGMAVGPTGTAYVISARDGEALPRVGQQAWLLTAADPTTPVKVPGFEAVRQREGNQVFVLGSAPLRISSQIAISPDGGTLYWKEAGPLSSPGTADEIVVHGYSLTEQKPASAFASGTTSCLIDTQGAALGTVGDRLIVLSQGLEVEEGETPPFGAKVRRFGPGGNGCSADVTDVTPNSGPTTGGTKVVFEGFNFEGTTAVTFAGVPAKSFNIVGPSKLEAVTPAVSSAPGQSEAVLTGPNGSSARGYNFTYLAPLPKFKLGVTRSGTGSGTVSSAPAGITCGADCSEEYEEGTVVALTQTPAVGSVFRGWSGACTGTGACQVTVSAAKSVVAQYGLVGEKFRLTVNKGGTGTGTVTSAPAGISCGIVCSAEIEEEATVTLTAVADAGSTFSGWSGACTGTGACQVKMGAAKTVAASFTAAATEVIQNQPPATSNPPATAPPTTKPSPKPKPKSCRKGFKKKTVKGKTTCVKLKKKHHTKKHGKGKK